MDRTALPYRGHAPIRATTATPYEIGPFHLGRVADDGLTAREPAASRYPELADRIAAGEDKVLSERLRRSESIGRPLGREAFVAGLEAKSGRKFQPARRGPVPKAAGA